MELFDFEFSLPHGFNVKKTTFDVESARIDIVGDDAEHLVTSVVKAAVAAGFSIVDQEPNRVVLERGEQRIVLGFDSTGLTIDTRDPTKLPLARHDGSAVLVGDLRVECGSASIVPLRERLMQDQWWRAAWKLSGISAPEVVRRVIDQAVASKGLVRGAMFDPPKGGRPRWKGEAYSRAERVDAAATAESDHVLLEIDLIDNRNDGRSH